MPEYVSLMSFSESSQRLGLVFAKPDDKKQQGWYVDREDAPQQGPPKSHRKHQLGHVFHRAELDLVDGILGQLRLVAFVLNLLREELYKLPVVSWHSHPHGARLTVERKPLQVEDAPPKSCVVFTSLDLVLRSPELVCGVDCARLANSWPDV